jgi:hypothetical protein
LVWAVAIEVLSIPTFGMTVFLAPIGLGFSTLAWRHAPHDAVFWIGSTLNALGFLALVGTLIGVLTGDVGIGFD